MTPTRFRKPHVQLGADQVAELVKLRGKGWTWRDLANRFRVAEDTARRHYREARRSTRP